jgi:hypothetical protein
MIALPVDSLTREGKPMKKILLLALLLFALPAAAQDDNEKIDVANYICAELITLPITTGGEAPVFTGLQIDGFVSANLGTKVADPVTLSSVLQEVFISCQLKPEKKVTEVWTEVRKKLPAATEGKWRADKTTCQDYADNPEDGSGFVIWLDGYNRAKSGKKASVLSSNESLKNYFEACAQKPNALMLDVMQESTR